MTEIKTEADPIMGDFHCVAVSNDRIFSVDNELGNAGNVGICDLFEQTSLNARLNLNKCESIGSELNISNIKAGFTANKDCSFIFDSSGCLVETTSGEEVYKLEKFVDGNDVNLTDEETMISGKPAKRFK